MTSAFGGALDDGLMVDLRPHVIGHPARPAQILQTQHTRAELTRRHAPARLAHRNLHQKRLHLHLKWPCTVGAS